MFCASHPQIHIIDLSIKYPKLPNWGYSVLVLPNLGRKSKLRMKTVTHEQKKVWTKQVLSHNLVLKGVSHPSFGFALSTSLPKGHVLHSNQVLPGNNPANLAN